jgi:hypothetical protein
MGVCVCVCVCVYQTITYHMADDHELQKWLNLSCSTKTGLNTETDKIKQQS